MDPSFGQGTTTYNIPRSNNQIACVIYVQHKRIFSEVHEDSSTARFIKLNFLLSEEAVLVKYC
jgi:hypothetical protein